VRLLRRTERREYPCFSLAAFSDQNVEASPSSHYRLFSEAHRFFFSNEGPLGFSVQSSMREQALSCASESFPFPLPRSPPFEERSWLACLLSRLSRRTFRDGLLSSSPRDSFPLALSCIFFSVSKSGFFYTRLVVRNHLPLVSSCFCGTSSPRTIPCFDESNLIFPFPPPG